MLITQLGLMLRLVGRRSQGRNVLGDGLSHLCYECSPRPSVWGLAVGGQSSAAGGRGCDRSFSSRNLLYLEAFTSNSE